MRLFVSQDPPPASTTRLDYEAWARERNEDLADGELRVIERGDSIRSVLRTGWERCLAVAREEMTLEEAQALTLAENLSEAGPLVGHHLAELVSRVSERSPCSASGVPGARGLPEEDELALAPRGH